jgi:hypothetical protein
MDRDLVPTPDAGSDRSTSIDTDSNMDGGNGQDTQETGSGGDSPLSPVRGCMLIWLYYLL